MNQPKVIRQMLITPRQKAARPISLLAANHNVQPPQAIKQTEAKPFKKFYNKPKQNYNKEPEVKRPEFIYGVNTQSFSNCFGPVKYDAEQAELHELTLDNIYIVNASKLFYFVSNSQSLDDMENAAKVITNLAKCHWHRKVDYNLVLDTELIKGICSSKRPVKLLNGVIVDTKLSKQFEASVSFDGLREHYNIDNNNFYKLYRALIPVKAISSFGSRTTASSHDSGKCEADYNFVRFLQVYKEMLIARNKIINEELRQTRGKLIKDLDKKLKQGEIDKATFVKSKIEIETTYADNTFQDADIDLLCSFIYFIFQHTEDNTLNYYLTIALVNLRISSVFQQLEGLNMVKPNWSGYFDDNEDLYDAEEYDGFMKEIMESNSPIKRILAEIVNNIKSLKNGLINLCQYDQNYRKILLNYLSQELFNKQKLPLIPKKVETKKTPEQIREEKEKAYLSSVKLAINKFVNCTTREQLNKLYATIDTMINNNVNKNFDIVGYIIDIIFNSSSYDTFTDIYFNPLLKLLRDHNAARAIRNKWLSIKYGPIARTHLFNWCILTRDIRLVKFMMKMDKIMGERKESLHFGILDNLSLVCRISFIHQLFETELYKDSLEFFKQQDSLNKSEQLDLIKRFALHILYSLKRDEKDIRKKYQFTLNDTIELFESFRPLPPVPEQEEIFEDVEETIVEEPATENILPSTPQIEEIFPGL